MLLLSFSNTKMNQRFNIRSISISDDWSYRRQIHCLSMVTHARRHHHGGFLYKVFILIALCQTSLGISPSSSISSILLASSSPFDNDYLEDDVENEYMPMDYFKERLEPNRILVSIMYALRILLIRPSYNIRLSKS